MNTRKSFYLVPVLLSLTILAFLPSKIAKAQDNDTKMILMVVNNAKLAGMCGTLKQMSAFQEATQMPGGNDFLVRFIKTEAARLGMEMPTLLKECVNITKMYADNMKILSK